MEEASERALRRGTSLRIGAGVGRKKKGREKRETEQYQLCFWGEPGSQVEIQSDEKKRKGAAKE